jgi:3-hydroxy-3-methylglutaryl CoA synthase
VSAALPVGIDDLALYASSQSVAFSDIASARALPSKALQTVRFERRSVLPLYEDPVTLAVNAATQVLAGIDRSPFELLIVATETGLDYGKPLSTYAHKALNLPSECRNFEIKHACFGGTASLLMASAWVRENPDKKALVLMTDIARRHVGELSELTGGAGALALVVSANPRVLELEPSTGRATREVYDVARPTATYEWGDSMLSLYAYLDLLDLAWAAYRKRAGAGPLREHFARMLYHAPLISLVEQAHRAVLESDHDDVSAGEIEQSFRQMVEPSLRLNRQVGNLYSGSLYTSIIGLLETRNELPTGSRIGLFSYGSGACSELFAARVVETARETIARHGASERLAARKPVDFDRYEADSIALEAALTARELVPSCDDALFRSAYQGRGLLVLEKVENYHRSYRWV